MRRQQWSVDLLDEAIDAGTVILPAPARLPAVPIAVYPEPRHPDLASEMSSAEERHRAELHAVRVLLADALEERDLARSALAESENRQIGSALERLTMTMTGRTAAELTAQLNDQIRSDRAEELTELDDDTVVVDVDDLLQEGA